MKEAHFRERAGGFLPGLLLGIVLAVFIVTAATLTVYGSSRVALPGGGELSIQLKPPSFLPRPQDAGAPMAPTESSQERQPALAPR